MNETEGPGVGVGSALVDVRGGASDEELAAVLAVVARRGQPRADDAADDPLQLWRRTRQAVTRPTRA